jgi:pyruvate dehydrogenase (quinone)
VVIAASSSSLGFVELEQKSEGLLPTYTDLKNPDVGKVAQAMGLWGRTVTDVAELESVVDEWLAVSGPALLNVKVAPMELVMPPAITREAAYGMAMYSVRAILHGQAGDVFEMIRENFPMRDLFLGRIQEQQLHRSRHDRPPCPGRRVRGRRLKLRGH